MYSLDRLMRSFTIRLRMVGAITMLVTLLGGIGLFGMLHVLALSQQLADPALGSAAQASALDGMRTATERVLYGFGGTLTLSLLVIVPLTIANFASILRPIRRANALARAIAGGDLTSRIDESGNDECAELMRSLNAMQTQLSHLVGQVRNATIGEITAAASEQSDGIGQVNVAVTHLDQMTQQNAALVEESAAAAESLQQQASSLSKVVGAFRLTSLA